MGVFDTVSSLGLPEEIAMHTKSIRTIFGFSDTFLGEHIETAFQALGLNERRADFVSATSPYASYDRREYFVRIV